MDTQIIARTTRRILRPFFAVGTSLLVVVFLIPTLGRFFANYSRTAWWTLNVAWDYFSEEWHNQKARRDKMRLSLLNQTFIYMGVCAGLFAICVLTRLTSLHEAEMLWPFTCLGYLVVLQLGGLVIAAIFAWRTGKATWDADEERFDEREKFAEIVAHFDASDEPAE